MSEESKELEEPTPSSDWRDWYRMTSLDRSMEGVSDQSDLAPGFSRETFLEWRGPRAGTTNPERIHSPVWEWFVRTGLNAYAGNKKFDGPSSFDCGAAWCCDRMGQTPVDLPDGSLVIIAGEHEDHYDPDFFIYNDVIVLHGNGEVEIYGYPLDVFPPTDFHTATRQGDQIILIGNLGFEEDKKPDETQVFILNPSNIEMSRQTTSGECPGWISRHTAELSDDGESILVKGGQIWRADKTLPENLDEWKLHLTEWRWERLTRRLWPRWRAERADGKRLHLWEYGQLKWTRKMNWDVGKDLANLRESLGGEPEEEAFASLYTPPVACTAPEEDEHDSRTTRISVDGVIVQYSADGDDVVVTIEGYLPAPIVEVILQDFTSKLERTERASVTLTPVPLE